MNEKEEIEFLEETKLISNTLESSFKIRNEPLNELGFRILQELNNNDPGPGLRIYSRSSDSTFNKYPDVFIKNIQKQLSLSNEDLINEIQILFIKGFVDFDVNLTDKVKKLIEFAPNGFDSNLIKYGSIFIEKFKGIERFRLTEKGFLALVDYSIKEMQSLKTSLEQLNEVTNQQLNDLKQLDDQRQKGIVAINEKIINTDNKINKFNDNIFTIFSLMIAVFAVIGININSIPKIQENFLENILVLNFSMCFSLVVLFYLLNTLIYKEKNNYTLTVLFCLFVIVFLVLCLLKFISTPT